MVATGCGNNGRCAVSPRATNGRRDGRVYLSLAYDPTRFLETIV